MRPIEVPPTITAAKHKAETYPNLCQWFYLCTNVAEYLVPHPVLGGVKTCGECVAKIERLSS